MWTDRRIRSAQTPRETAAPVETGLYDNYLSRLIKLIPAEVIAFYLALDAIASNLPHKEAFLWTVLAISLIGCWFYLGKMANVPGIGQRVITLCALVIWVYVFGGPFALLDWYDVNYGKLVLVVFTFFVPLIYKGTENPLPDPIGAGQ